MAYLNRQPGHSASGRLEVLRTPPHYDFVELRRTPKQLREYFASLGWTKVVAFQTRNPLHRAHEELTKRAATQIDGGLLIHPVVGVTKPGDVDHFTRVRCYRALVDNHYKPGSVVLSLLPLAMRMAGPREVLLHAIIRRNHGCSHFIVGRDHAGPGNDSTGKPFYPPYAAQESMAQHQDELGMQMVDFKQMVYLPDENRYCPVDEVPAGARTADISGTQVRDNYLAKGLQLPEWFSRPAVAEILNETSPPKFRQGLTIWFTGLSGSGKSTVAQPWSSGWPSSAATSRSWTATRSAPTSPRASASARKTATRTSTASATSPDWSRSTAAPPSARSSAPTESRATTPGSTPRGTSSRSSAIRPIEVCEQRDVKGLYAKARAGQIKGFTGVDDPYEPPLNPEVTLDTSKQSVQECVDQIIDKLIALGYILPHGHIVE